MSKIVTITHRYDLHEMAVAWALRELGHKAVLWPANMFPDAGEISLRTGGGKGSRLFSKDMGEAVSDADVVWLRRGFQPKLPLFLPPGDRTIAWRESSLFLEGCMQSTFLSAKWVNPPISKLRYQSKAMQIIVADEVGFLTPPTLMSNNPDDIKRFIREECGGDVAFKSFYPMQWKSGKKMIALNTSVFDQSLLEKEDSVRACPAIYQKYIHKAFEVRATFMGKSCISVKLDSQKHELTKFDWRRGQALLKPEPFELPAEIHSLCVKLMHELGILFGCFDFVVGPDGEYYFLEVNEMGQFLWVEEKNPDVPMLSAFASFIADGSPDFCREFSANGITYERFCRENDISFLWEERVDSEVRAQYNTLVED